eukprot:scaffold7242_cov137-Cylindrotheca_fusiformis.AAC.4
MTPRAIKDVLRFSNVALNSIVASSNCLVVAFLSSGRIAGMALRIKDGQLVVEQPGCVEDNDCQLYHPAHTNRIVRGRVPENEL